MFKYSLKKKRFILRQLCYLKIKIKIKIINALYPQNSSK